MAHHYDEGPPADAKQAGVQAFETTGKPDDLLAACRHQAAWIRQLLSRAENKTVYNQYTGCPAFSYTCVEVAEWELRQKLGSLEQDIAAATEGGK